MRFLYEDEWLFVINKPAGLHSVGLPRGGGASVADQLLERMPAQGKISEKQVDAGLVHRLDQMTSGVLLGSKSRTAWKKLRNQLLEGKIDKSYLAVLEGKLEKPKVHLETFIGSPNRNSKKVKVYTRKPNSKARALPATSTFFALAYESKPDLTLVRVVLDEGRRHQIRAHAAFLGHPLVGDSLYGSKRSLGDMPEFMLHAQSLSFLHPQSNKQMTVRAPVPDWLEDFRRRGLFKNVFDELLDGVIKTV